MAQPLPSRPLPAICVVGYSVLVAAIVPFVLIVLFAAIGVPRGFLGDLLADPESDRLIWKQVAGFYFLMVLPISALVGVLAGMWIARSRRRRPGALTPEPRFPPLHAALLGMCGGAFLLVLAAFAIAVLDDSPHEFFDVSSLWQVTAVGGIGGAVIGFATWVGLTPRLVHPLYLALAWGVLGAVIATLLFVGYMALNPDLTRSSGHGNYFAGLEYLMWYLFGVLPTSIVLGLIFGGILGSVRRARSLKHEEPQFRVE